MHWWSAEGEVVGRVLASSWPHFQSWQVVGIANDGKRDGQPAKETENFNACSSDVGVCMVPQAYTALWANTQQGDPDPGPAGTFQLAFGPAQLEPIPIRTATFKANAPARRNSQDEYPCIQEFSK